MCIYFLILILESFIIVLSCYGVSLLLFDVLKVFCIEYIMLGN